MGVRHSRQNPRVRLSTRENYSGIQFKFQFPCRTFVAFTDEFNCQDKDNHKCQIGINYAQHKYIFYDINDLPDPLKKTPPDVGRQYQYLWIVKIPDIATVTVRSYRNRKGKIEDTCFETNMFELVDKHNSYDYLRYRPDILRKRKAKYHCWNDMKIMKDMAIIDVDNDIRRFSGLDKMYQTKELAYLAVERKEWNFEYVRPDLQDEELCKLALEGNEKDELSKGDADNIKFVRSDLLTEEMVEKYCNESEESNK